MSKTQHPEIICDMCRGGKCVNNASCILKTKDGKCKPVVATMTQKRQCTQNKEDADACTNPLANNAATT